MPSPPDSRPPQPERTDAARQLAAVDLGSNSFHLVIARSRGDEIALLDRVRDPVQLARGLGSGKRLTKKARDRALRSLQRFRQRLRHVPAERVRAVGTSTLRSARNATDFLAEAEEALGHPIEIISGHEEARLIYLGVAHSLANEPGPRLVVDIGGGSTECIRGERFEALEVHSLDIGCVRFARRYFPKGRIASDAFRDAWLAAAAEFQTIERSLREAGWIQAVGASGTIRAADAILRANEWSTDGITAAGLKKIRKAVLAAPNTAELKIKGLKSERAAVFPGGLAILMALFNRLEVESMTPAPGALREGVMYDLLGRIRHEDVRERTIRNFQERYGVDPGQAARVERMALALLSHAPAAWDLDPTRDGRLLAWGARLHEIGLTVSWGRYQQHSAYLVAHADMPGFSRDEQRLLATVVACHRRKIDPAVLAPLGDASRAHVTRLIVLLRLAVLLHRSRSPEPLPPFRLEDDGATVRLCAPPRWLAAHPLTKRDLIAEAGYLHPLGVDFAVTG